MAARVRLAIAIANITCLGYMGHSNWSYLFSLGHSNDVDAKWAKMLKFEGVKIPTPHAKRRPHEMLR